MPGSEIEKFILQTAGTVTGDWWAIAGTVGMTVEEFEHLAGIFRREVEDRIRAARVRLLERLEEAPEDVDGDYTGMGWAGKDGRP